VPSTFVHTLVTVDVPGPSPYELVATTTGHYRLVDVTDVTPQVVRGGHDAAATMFEVGADAVRLNYACTFASQGLVGNDTITVVAGPTVFTARPERPPTARFLSASADACTGSYMSAEMRLTGTPPFSIVFERYAQNSRMVASATIP